MGIEGLITNYACSAPCLNCEDRQIGCHGSCEKYIAYKQELEARKNAERISKTTINYKPKRRSNYYGTKRKIHHK